MSTADKTKSNSVNAFRGGACARLVTGYRWIASVFSRRAGFNHGNDLQGLNAHQLRDLGMEGHMDEITSRQEKLERARLNSLLLLMGLSGR
jgi:hypothetical protein